MSTWKWSHANKGEKEWIFQLCIYLFFGGWGSSNSSLLGLSATNCVNLLSVRLPQYGQRSLLDKWDASFMRGGRDACLDWFRHPDICSVRCVVCLLDWWEDWGWRVTNWWRGGHCRQTTGPIIKGSEMPQVQADFYYQRKLRLQRVGDQLCPCQ